MDSPVFQTVIGLVFIFAVTAGLVSLVTESISRYIGLRAEFLLRGLRTLLDGNGKFELPFWRTFSGTISTVDQDQQDRAKTDFAALRISVAPAAPPAPGAPPPTPAAVAATTSAAATAAAAATKSPAELADPGQSGTALVALILAHPLVAATSDRAPDDRAVPAGDAPMTNRQRRGLPAYISGRTFSRALVDLLIADANNATTMNQIMRSIDNLANPQLKAALTSLATDINGQVETFRTNVENWYDDQMARVSGWYKRYTRWVSLGIGVILVLAFNFNVLTMAHSLYSDQTVAAAIVGEATAATSCAGKEPTECLKDLAGNISSARETGLPIGWATVATCAPKGSGCNAWEAHGLWLHNGGVGSQIVHLLTLLLGWLLMVVALLPGANFWFDLLGRLGTLRNTGPKPASS